MVAIMGGGFPPSLRDTHDGDRNPCVAPYAGVLYQAGKHDRDRLWKDCR